jgi:NADH:ubiquinone oxidoreductase subunit D
VQAAVDRHRLAGLPLVVWLNGQPAQVMATEIRSDVPAIVGSPDIVMGEIDR